MSSLSGGWLQKVLSSLLGQNQVAGQGHARDERQTQEPTATAEPTRQQMSLAKQLAQKAGLALRENGVQGGQEVSHDAKNPSHTPASRQSDSQQERGRSLG